MDPEPAVVSWKDWVAAIGGFLVAVLLIAQLFVTIAWGADLGTSPGLFVLGAALLVMSWAIIFDRGRTHPSVSRVVKTLLVIAGVLIVLALLHVI